MTDFITDLSRLTNGEPDDAEVEAALDAYIEYCIGLKKPRISEDDEREAIRRCLKAAYAVHNTALLAEAAKRFRAIASPAEIEARKEAARRAADAGNSAAYQYHLGCLETLVKIWAQINAPWGEETKE